MTGPGRSQMRCAGSTYVSVGRSEPDDPLTQVAECNGPQDCGWSFVMQEWSDLTPDGEWDVAVTSEDFLPLHAEHLAYSATPAEPTDAASSQTHDTP